MSPNAKSVRRTLALEPHPEGGWFREVYRSPMTVGHPHTGELPERSAITAIHFMLEAGDFSAWHRVHSDEIWHHAGGGAIELYVIGPDRVLTRVLLGPDLSAGHAPFAVVPAGALQAAKPTDNAEWALASCFVSPGFDFSDFEMPTRAQMMEWLPEHAETIAAFTRS